MTIKDLTFIFDGGAVGRFHTAQVIKPNTVAEHSFGVAWFCYILSDKKPSVNLLMAALAHDLAEQEVGDVPAPAKRALGLKTEFAELENHILQDHDLYFELNDKELHILKLADCFDGVMYCIREMSLGNHRAAVIARRYFSYINEMPLSPAEASLLNVVLNAFNMRTS